MEQQKIINNPVCATGTGWAFAPTEFGGIIGTTKRTPEPPIRALPTGREVQDGTLRGFTLESPRSYLTAREIRRRAIAAYGFSARLARAA